MMAFLMSLVGLIPGLTTLASNWVAASYNSKVAIVSAQIGGDVAAAQAIVAAQVAADQTRAQGLAVIASSTLLSILTVLFAGPLVLYTWKIIGYDIIVGSFYGCHGKTTLEVCAAFNTDPIKGDVASWASSIIWCLFGSSVAVHGISSIVGAITKAGGK